VLIEVISGTTREGRFSERVAAASRELEQLRRRLDRADGFIVLTAEYNHGYPAVLKNAMDWTFVEWRRKPISFVGSGRPDQGRARC
jgi:NAD(P)H-dependent FMN reductase